VSPTPDTGKNPTAPARGTWAERYGERHRLVRVDQFPAGITAPQKVRLYARRAHFVLQWWDPRARATLSDRVDGDLVSALSRAREIDRRLADYKTAGLAGTSPLSHPDLVGAYLEDLGRRADAGEIAAGTVDRYRAALAHYLVFCGEPVVRKGWPYAARANRDFRLAFAAHLATRAVRPNGRAGAAPRPMRATGFVLDAVRALYAWAADPDRGRLLSDGFRNPFERASAARSIAPRDPLAAPDVTTAMAVELVNACDRYQLRLFAPMVLFGLRAAEPCFLFAEDLTADWLAVPNRPALAVLTKGRRDKWFPLVPALAPLWDLLRAGLAGGLLFHRRAVGEGRERPPLAGRSADGLTDEYRRRLTKQSHSTARVRQQVRDQVFRDAGGITYDDVEGEFKRLAGRLSWPPAATPKDLRHLFATTMTDAGVTDGYLKYLMGHAPGRGALAAYVHLHDVGAHVSRVLAGPWAGLVRAINDGARATSA
jgi:hypothetical protein